MDLDRLDAGDPGALSEMRNADVLVSTSSHTTAVQRYAPEVNRPSVIISLRADLVDEMMRLLDEGAVYFVCMDGRFAQALGDVLRPTGRDMNARVLVLGQDDLQAIPAGAPTYVTAAAREHATSTARLRRVVPMPRIFSLQCARELLTFIAFRNIAALQTLTT